MLHIRFDKDWFKLIYSTFFVHIHIQYKQQRLGLERKNGAYIVFLLIKIDQLL